WFSPVVAITAAAGKTNEVEVELGPCVKLAGRLDETVPRPVRKGRVIAQVSPPEWHAWSEVRDDGSFEIASLPQGDLEIVALCDGYVSTNGPGQFPHMHYPQKYSLDTNDLSVTVGMMPTAALEVTVTDDQGKPLKDAVVAAWPNVRYGE